MHLGLRRELGSEVAGGWYWIIDEDEAGCRGGGCGIDGDRCIELAGCQGDGRNRNGRVEAAVWCDLDLVGTSGDGEVLRDRGEDEVGQCGCGGRVEGRVRGGHVDIDRTGDVGAMNDADLGVGAGGSSGIHQGVFSVDDRCEVGELSEGKDSDVRVGGEAAGG